MLYFTLKMYSPVWWPRTIQEVCKNDKTLQEKLYSFPGAYKIFWFRKIAQKGSFHQSYALLWLLWVSRKTTKNIRCEKNCQLLPWLFQVNLWQSHSSPQGETNTKWYNGDGFSGHQNSPLFGNVCDWREGKVYFKY